jgi:hypothetical protein
VFTFESCFAVRVRHDAGMDQKIRDLSAAMCSLLDEQSKLLNKGAKFSEMSGEELGDYAVRNDRIHQLWQELNDLV